MSYILQFFVEKSFYIVDNIIDMDKKTNFTSEELLNKKFSVSKNGYNPLEVDKVLDQIIEDYEKYELSGNPGGVDIDRIAKELQDLKKENEILKNELEKEKNKWKYISKDHKDIHIDNYELLLRIGKLEMIIYEKLNMNPDDIK